MYMHNSLKDKTTLVTGVTSGIGREIAQLLAERGARVFGTVRNPQSASPIPGVEIVRMDVTDDSSVNEAVQSIVRNAGPIQYLVNNAGYSLMGALEETSVDEARQQFETNLFGVLRVTNAILPGMRQQSFGRIVNISSVLGFLPAPYLEIYAASKHAVEGLTQSAALEGASFGVRVNSVAPGPTDTSMLDRFTGTPEKRANLVAGVPLHRTGTPEELAAAIVFMASPKATFITGTTLVVDGGKLAR